MASDVRTLIGEVLVALRADLGDYDLSTTSGTARVVVGEYEEPPTSGAPFIALRYERGRSGYGVSPLGQYETAYDLVVVCWAPCDLDDPSERALDAMDLAAEVITALQAAHYDGVTYPTINGCTRLEVEDIEIYGDGVNLPAGYGVATFTVRIQRILTRGI